MIRSLPLTLSDGTILASNYFNYTEAEDEIVSTATEYQERGSLVYTPQVVGNYLLRWYVEVYATPQAKSAGIKVVHNESILAETAVSMDTVDPQFESIAGRKVINIDDSEQIFALYFKSFNGKEIRVRRARLFLSKV